MFTSSLPQYILPEVAHILSVLYILLRYTSNEGVYSALKRKKTGLLLLQWGIHRLYKGEELLSVVPFIVRGADIP